MFPIGDENEPGHGLAWVTATLIGINVAVFVLLQGLGAENAFTTGFSAVPLEITTGPILSTQSPSPSPVRRTWCPRRQGRSRSSSRC